MDKLNELFENVFNKEKPVKLVFSSKRYKSIEYSKVAIRPILISSVICYQAEYSFENKVTHQTIQPDEAADFCLALLENEFKEANIFTEDSHIQVMASKPNSPRIIRKASALRGQNLAHNRTKNYIIPDGKPCDFLVRLGVMDKNGKVFQKHYGKFRQINRYLEIVDDCFPHLGSEDGHTIKIIDFGCGKAYLTFAIYHYLKIIKGLNVEIIGLDLKKNVIDLCNKIAKDLGYNELRFLMGDIADYTNDRADMVVTLHACDTATDYALINAVEWNTKVILSVPCCQHELFNQIKDDVHQPMLKHGILKDRLTEYLTDGLRGLKLESRGYDVSMIEFTSLEHTARNILIKAVKLPTIRDAKRKKAQKQYEALRDFYQVQPTIDKL